MNWSELKLSMSKPDAIRFPSMQVGQPIRELTPRPVAEPVIAAVLGEPNACPLALETLNSFWIAATIRL